MFLVISAISIAIVNRAIQGTILTLDSKKGYSAYQASDSAAEVFLNNLKALDNNIAGNRIPENARYNEAGFCDGNTIKCFNAASPSPTQIVSGYLSEVYKLRSQGVDAASQGLNRKIQADVSDRINSGLGSGDFTVTNCGDGVTPCTWNRCDVKLSVTPGGGADVTKKIQDYEVRKSMQGSLKADYTVSGNGWWIATNRNASGVFVPFWLPVTTPSSSVVLKNGDEKLSGALFGSTPGSLANSGGQYNEHYFFTIKARNKYPLSLDSLYLDTSGTGAGTTNKEITIESTSDCNTGDLLGGLECVKLCTSPGQAGCQPRGTVTATQSYNCCNGTECFQPDPNWTPQLPEENCALQKCVNREGYLTSSSSHYPSVTDTVAVGIANGVTASGNGITTGLGWCKTAQACVPGDACLHPYRTVGYCLTCPAAAEGSDPSIKLNSNSWSPQNKIDVDMNPRNGYYDGVSFTTYHTTESDPSQPRCCKQLCPDKSGTPPTIVSNPDAYCSISPFKKASWNTADTSCANNNNCGPYTLTKRCNLTCATNYNPFNNAGDPEYPSGKCCSENCPSVSPPFISHDNAPTVTLGACNYTLDPYHGTSWVNTSTCASNTKCANAGDPGYTVTERCRLVCDYDSGKYGVTNPTIFTGTSKACCYHKCSDWTNPGCTQAIPAHSTRTGNYYCSERSCGDYNITNNCDFQCDFNYTRSGGICVPNTRSATCNDKPATGTVWNTSSTFTQTWDGDTWEPSTKSAVHSDEASSGDCRYKCANNYTWDGWNCVGSTQTFTCSAKPGGSTTMYNTVDSYPQTWSGSWSPVADATTDYDVTGSTTSCRYKCANGYTRVGSNCVSSAPTCSIVWGTSINSPVATYSSTSNFALTWVSTNAARLVFSGCWAVDTTYWAGLQFAPDYGGVSAGSWYMGTGPWASGQYQCFVIAYAADGTTGTCNTGIVTVP